jgi:hypothetical protein
MPRPTKLVRNDYEDSLEDYEDLLDELQVPQEAQQLVFNNIKAFQQYSDIPNRIRTGTEAAHSRINTSFMGHWNRKELDAIELLRGPLKDLCSKEKNERSQKL